MPPRSAKREKWRQVETESPRKEKRDRCRLTRPVSATRSGRQDIRERLTPWSRRRQSRTHWRAIAAARLASFSARADPGRESAAWQPESVAVTPRIPRIIRARRSRLRSFQHAVANFPSRDSAREARIVSISNSHSRRIMNDSPLRSPFLCRSSRDAPERATVALSLNPAVAAELRPLPGANILRHTSAIIVSVASTSIVP